MVGVMLYMAIWNGWLMFFNISQIVLLFLYFGSVVLL